MGQCTTQKYIEKEHLNYTTSSATNTYPYVAKWLADQDIHNHGSSYFGTPKQNYDAQITQTLQL